MDGVATIANVSDPAVIPEIETIFFANAATQEFASEAQRTAYRDLWLSRYLRHCPRECLVATSGSSNVLGYLAGALFSNKEPLAGPDYYTSFPAGLIETYPAHVHVNVRADHRGKAIGSTLIDAFRAICRSHDLSGFHAVTAAESRAATFFIRCGLAERATADWRGRRLVFLGELLPP